MHWARGSASTGVLGGAHCYWLLPPQPGVQSFGSDAVSLMSGGTSCEWHIKPANVFDWRLLHNAPMEILQQHVVCVILPVCVDGQYICMLWQDILLKLTLEWFVCYCDAHCTATNLSMCIIWAGFLRRHCDAGFTRSRSYTAGIIVFTLFRDFCRVANANVQRIR